MWLYCSDWQEIIATFSSPVLAPFTQPAGTSQTLDLKYFADDRSLVILLAGGDIATLQLEGPEGDVAPVSMPRLEGSQLIVRWMWLAASTAASGQLHGPRTTSSLCW